jgi:hypothetical protein
MPEDLRSPSSTNVVNCRMIGPKFSENIAYYSVC